MAKLVHADIPKAFSMIELVADMQARIDRILRIFLRQKRLKELHAYGDREAMRDFLESEFRADPNFMRMCLKVSRRAALQEQNP